MGVNRLKGRGGIADLGHSGIGNRRASCVREG